MTIPCRAVIANFLIHPGAMWRMRGYLTVAMAAVAVDTCRLTPICVQRCFNVSTLDSGCHSTLCGPLRRFNPLTATLFNRNFHSLEVVSLTRSATSSEWKLLRFDKMEVDDFDILLIDVTFCSQHVQKMVFNVLIKKKTNFIGPAVNRLTLVLLVCYIFFKYVLNLMTKINRI